VVNEPCPVCGHRLPREFLATHMARAHPGAPVGGAASPAPQAPPSGAYQGDLAHGLAPPESADATVPPEVADAPAVLAADDEPRAEAPPPTDGVMSSPGRVPPPPLPTGSNVGASAAASGVAASPREAGTSAASASSPAANDGLPTSKELRQWLHKHRRSTEDGAGRAQAWCTAYAASRHHR
jgi:hypothetical protein